ncbi:hypothetical protein AHF37_01793 [Paragonimus kellicotti]|nr:hypothetical protein AHF37_01793 [Paragonimus kellicotti]
MYLDYYLRKWNLHNYDFLKQLNEHTNARHVRPNDRGLPRWFDVTKTSDTKHTSVRNLTHSQFVTDQTSNPQASQQQRRRQVAQLVQFAYLAPMIGRLASDFQAT